jgi:hypothetical protein
MVQIDLGVADGRRNCSPETTMAEGANIKPPLHTLVTVLDVEAFGASARGEAADW